MIGKVALLIVGIVFLIWGIKRFITAKQNYDAIDCVATAKVTRILNLGKNSSGKNEYAVTYNILIEEPFELLVTPTTMELDVGSEVAFYYAHDNPKENYYFAHRWNIDTRFKAPVVICGMGLIMILGAVLSFF